MDTDAFIRWALDGSRTVEERCTVEVLVETGVRRWNWKRKKFETETMDESMTRRRERKLNPAYDPHYTEESLLKAVEYLSTETSWYFHSDRPIRNVAALGFMDSLEEIHLCTECEITSVEPLALLPRLRKLTLGYAGSVHYNSHCRDYTPLARCTALRELSLNFNCHWPDFRGIETLTQLEELTLSGNLHALPRGATFPNVRKGALYCMPLAARDVADLPHFPSCEFLTLKGAEKLDGIEHMPLLRNLDLHGPVESFAPLVALKELTCLTVEPDSHLDPDKMPRDITPLARLPKLHYLKMGPRHDVYPDVPRDFSPLAEAPALRELVIQNCPPVEMEVSAIQAGLQPCDDLYLAPEPRPIPPLRIIVAPYKMHPSRKEEQHSPGETGAIDTGLRESEGRWVGAYLQQLISQKIGHSDWGKAYTNGLYRSLSFTLESFECVGKLPLIIDTVRECMAALHDDYNYGHFMISLTVPPIEETPAQRELRERFEQEQDEAEYERNKRDRAEYLERLHRLELKKQEGAEITPEEFSPDEPTPLPEPPWERECEDDDGAEDDGDIAIKEKPEPPPRFLDDEHPLADNYSMMGSFTLNEVWFLPHSRDLAAQLMGREPDEEIPEEATE